jgi:hypothetical protein
MRSLRCSSLHPDLGHLDRRISRRWFSAAPLSSPRLAQAPDDPAQAAALGRSRARWPGGCGRGRRSFGRGWGGRVRVFSVARRRAARWATAPPPSRRPCSPLWLGGRGGGSGHRRGFGHRPVGTRRPASSPPPSGCCRRGGRRVRRHVWGVLAVLRRQVAPDLGSHLALGAQRAVRRVDVDSPHDDRGGRPADRRPLLGQRPAGVDRVAGVHGTGKLPVEPFPFLDRRHRHVDRAQPDRHGDQERGRGYAGAAGGGFDREWREIARHPGKQRDLRFGNGAPPGGPFTT